jgi:hypothetical protein
VIAATKRAHRIHCSHGNANEATILVAQHYVAGLVGAFATWYRTNPLHDEGVHRSYPDAANESHRPGWGISDENNAHLYKPLAL